VKKGIQKGQKRKKRKKEKKHPKIIFCYGLRSIQNGLWPVLWHRQLMSGRQQTLTPTF